MATLQAFKGCSVLRRSARPFSVASRRAVVVRAEASQGPVPPLEWPKDNETIRDVFAFAGSAPERVNGRVAMIGFVSILAPEIAKKQPVLEQLGNNWFGVLLFSLTITMASILPKIIAGVPLSELHASATGDNLKGEGWQAVLSLFDTNVELWSGRLAMLGFAGLALIEAFVKGGESFF